MTLGRFEVILGIRRWFWVAFGALLGHLGVTLGTLWHHFWHMRVSLDHLEVTLKSLRGQFGFNLGSLLAYERDVVSLEVHFGSMGYSFWW